MTTAIPEELFASYQAGIEPSCLDLLQRSYSFSTRRLVFFFFFKFKLSHFVAPKKVAESCRHSQQATLRPVMGELQLAKPLGNHLHNSPHHHWHVDN
jgi:hypothetical protein